MNCKSVFLPVFVILLSFASACLSAPSITALTFKHADGRSAPAEIYVDGEITPGLPQQLSTALAANRIERGTVYLNSVGGDLQAGMQLGALIRTLGLNTAIGVKGRSYGKAEPGACQSACLLSYAGGIYRFADTRSFIGIHRFYARSPSSQDLALGQIMSAAITGFLMRMGISAQLFERMVNAGSEPRKLSIPDAVSLGLVNDGVLPPSWNIAGRKGEVFLEGEQQTWNGIGKIQLFCAPSYGARLVAMYNAEHNTRRILAEASSGSLRINDQLSNRAQTAPGKSLRERDGYLITEASLSRETALTLSGTRSIGFAWLPKDPLIFYGFDIPTRGAEDVIDSFVAHCARRM